MVDRQKYSVIAHRSHRFCNPLSEECADRLIALLELPPGARVIDVGCGKAEWLLRIAERYEITGVGVDRCEEFLDEGRQQAAARLEEGRLSLVCSEMRDFEVTGGSFDLALSIGASQAFGSHRDNLRALAGLVRKGGRVLVGEGYWKQEPSREYLEGLECSRKDLSDFAGNVEIAVQEGLTPLYWEASSLRDWDRYESLYLKAVESYAQEAEEDPDVPAMLERAHRWRDLYLRWGRDTLGFGVYLFRA